jgi:signal peptidase II
MTRILPGGRAVAVIAGIVVVGVGLDQATKAWAVAGLTEGQPVRLIGQVFQLQLLRNPGAAFSTAGSATVVLACLALVVLVAVSVLVVPRVRCWPWVAAVGLGLAGVAGNFIDRLVRAPGPFRGHVIDFMSLKYFAVFNVADIMLTSAAVLIVLIAAWWKVDFAGRPAGKGAPAGESAPGEQTAQAPGAQSAPESGDQSAPEAGLEVDNRAQER